MLAAGSCSDKPAMENEVPVVVVTTTHLSDLVHSLAGKQVKVISLMGPGVDPHLYKPASRDLSSLAKADLIVFHGLLLEGRMAQALEQADRGESPRLRQPPKYLRHSSCTMARRVRTDMRIRMFGSRLKFGRFASTL